MKRTTLSWSILFFLAATPVFAGDMSKAFVCSERAPTQVINQKDFSVIILRFAFSSDHYDIALHQPDQAAGVYTYFKSTDVHRKGEDDVIVKGIADNKTTIEIRARELDTINGYGTLDGIASLRLNGELIHPDLTCEYPRKSSVSGIFR